MAIGVISAIGGLLSSVVTGWSETKKTKTELKKAELVAESEFKQKKLSSDSDYDTAAINAQRYSWKDEFLTLTIVAPLVCTFLPWTQDYVLQGWDALDMAPLYYQVILCGVYVSVFGLKGWLKLKDLNLFKR